MSKSFKAHDSKPAGIAASIIIPVHDDLSGLEITLQSLSDNKLIANPLIEVIVCNDGGGSVISVLAARFGCREAILEKNSGSYAARNAGIRTARGEILVFLDADQRVDAAWLDSGLDALRNSDYVGGRILIELPASPSLAERFDYLTAFPVPDYLERSYFAPTANLFIKRSVIEYVGLFREEMRSGGDCELGVRVHQAGFQQTYCEAAVTYHPARDFSSQYRKWRRVADGVAQLKICIWQEPSFPLLISLFYELIVFIPKIVWHFLKFGVFRVQRPDKLTVQYVFLRDIRTGAISFWTVVGILKRLRPFIL